MKGSIIEYESIKGIVLAEPTIETESGADVLYLIRLFNGRTKSSGTVLTLPIEKFKVLEYR